MLTLDVKGKTGSYILTLPTSISEITSDYISSVTDNVVLDENYSLIGLVYRERLSTLILAARKNNKKSDIAVIPIFVDAGKTNSQLINSLRPCDKIIIAPSDIMLGHHVSTPRNLLTINTILDIIEGDTNVYNQLLSIQDYCYFIEFKIVPNCNIHGAYKNYRTENFSNPFVTKTANAEVNNKKSNIIV